MSVLQWLFGRKARQAHDTQPDTIVRPRVLCHGCSSDRIEMVCPASPEASSYRCAACGREWTARTAPRISRV